MAEENYPGTWKSISKEVEKINYGNCIHLFCMRGETESSIFGNSTVMVFLKYQILLLFEIIGSHF
jgi:hypothetical protein